MAFEIENFSPVGGNARGGNLPFQSTPPSKNSIQVFTYSSRDSISTILTNGYFNEVGRGYVRRGDWIDIALAIGGGSKTQMLRFVLGDGSIPSAFSALVAGNAGLTYAIGELVTVTYVDGTIEQNTVIEILNVGGGGFVSSIEIVDPGFFSVAPTTLTGLATVGGGDNALTVDLTLATQPSDGLVTLSPLAITAV